jgi:hypothetical protein
MKELGNSSNNEFHTLTATYAFLFFIMRANVPWSDNHGNTGKGYTLNRGTFFPNEGEQVSNWSNILLKF